MPRAKAVPQDTDPRHVDRAAEEARQKEVDDAMTAFLEENYQEGLRALAAQERKERGIVLVEGKP